MAAPDTPEGFTVRDRRIRGSDLPPDPPSSRPPGIPPPEPYSAQPGAPEGGDLAPEPDLGALVVFLANFALLHLGEAPEGEAGGLPPDLDQARFTIELLRVLKGKTEGNRTPEEGRLLEAILYDLQMRFVRAVSPR